MIASCAHRNPAAQTDRRDLHKPGPATRVRPGVIGVLPFVNVVADGVALTVSAARRGGRCELLTTHQVVA
jgi:hypothetical protein